MPAANDHTYCVWDSPSEPVSIWLNLRVVDSVRQWINESNANQEEIGGILLGRLEQSEDKTVIIVENCQPAHISHRRGPAFTLTDQERDRLCKKFSQPHKDGLTAVGFIRSDLRNYLQPDVSDMRLLREASPEAIFLLVRPEEWIARCFRASEESIGPRFPFDREGLRQTGMTIIQTPGSLPDSRKWLFQQWAPALVTCLLLIAAAAAYFWPRPQTAPAARGFGLNVEHLGKVLRLTWNPQALHGRTVLRVNDGDSHQSIALDGRQVASGSALYVPASNEVTFRLETPASADSIRIVVPRPQPIPPPQLLAAAVPKTPVPKPAPKKLQVRHPQPTPPLQAHLQTAERVMPRPEPVPVATLTPPVHPPVPVQQAISPAELAPKPAAPDSLVTVSYAARPEANRHGIEKVPVLRMLKHSHAIEAARPVSAIQPRVPHALVLRAETQVEVEASIDKEGRVSNVEPLWSQGDERLLRVVLEAVSHASFYPARSNGRDVSSKLVLTFHFGDQTATRASRAEAH